MNTAFSKLTCIFALMAMVAIASTAGATLIVFDGLGTDPNLAFAADNYDPETTVTRNTAITKDVTMTNITLNATDFAGGTRRYRMAEGFSLTLDNTTFVTNSTGGMSGPHGTDDTGAAQDSTATADFFFTNGSSVDIQFADRGAIFHVDSTSLLHFRGNGDPIKQHTDFPSFTHVELAPGGQLSLGSGSAGGKTEQEIADLFLAQGAEILVNGVPYSDGTTVLNPGILSFVDNTATAVPEPSSLVLLGFASVATLSMRRWRSTRRSA